MAKIHALIKILIIVFVCSCASGCNDALEKCQQENYDLHNALDNHQAEINIAEDQASIARGCDYLVSVCSDSVTKVGHEALAHNFPGTGYQFWVMLILKLLALPCIFGAWCAGVLLSYKVIKTCVMIPNEAVLKRKRFELEKAEYDIVQANEKADEIIQQAMDIRAEADNAAATLEELNAQEAITQAEILSAEKVLASVRTAITEAEQALVALSDDLKALRGSNT